MMHTAESVLTAFQRATEFAKRLPNVGPKGYGNPWPEILRLGHEGYCENDKPSPALTADEMAEYETKLSWMGFIKEDVFRRILWYYAAGVPGWKIAKAIDPRVSQSTISRRIMWVLGFIVYKVNHGEVPPVIRYQSD